MYKRNMVEVVRKRLTEKRRFIQVILGPRQAGKTTAIQQVLEEITAPSHYAAADLPAPPDTGWIARQWEMARMKTEASKPVVLVLDEIQKVAHWSDEVKRLWDEDSRLNSDIHVVLLGSSSLLIQKGLSESLAGRFELVRFPHWSWTEMRECFGLSLEQYVYFGGYPASASLMQDENRWGQYVRDSLIETALSKDILLLNRVEKPVLLRQLFVLACEYSGQILSYQKILGQLQDVGNTVTVAHYQRFLEAAFLIRGLQKWSGKAVRSRSSSPKWLALNSGLVSSLSNRTFNEWRSDPAQWGRLVETGVGAHLANRGVLNGVDIYYWREGNNEVDFVLRKGNVLTAIEVKSGQKRIASKGLAEFKKQYPRAHTLIVGTGGMALKEFFETPIVKLMA
ncbi:MAG: ATP-binding protein [Candidatus Omnitrophica bacterium]|nr:ATP-binding protein [Candidatus Omnitrophota bacterium]